MQIQVQVENVSKVQRKLTITVDAKSIEKEFERQLISLQKTARIKGFRPGQVPMSMVQKVYGDDARHRVFHQVVDDSFRRAVTDNKLNVVGRPQIDLPESHESHGALVGSGKSLTYTAVVEVLPDVEVKKYSGFSLKKPKADVSDADVEKVLAQFQDGAAQIVPVDAKGADRKVKKGDFVDFEFDGALLTKDGPKKHQALTGTRMAEIGGNQLIPGFEDELIGMKPGESKTFKLALPKDDPELGGQEAEFTVKLNELKKKELPEINDDLAKQFGYADLNDLRTRTRERMVKSREQESQTKLREELFDELIKANPFDLPESVVAAQANNIARDFAGRLKQQGFSDDVVQNALNSEKDDIRKRADGQVRVGLLMDKIAEKEAVKVTPEAIEAEYARMAQSTNMDVAKIKEHYRKNPSNLEDLEYKLREDATIALILSKCKVS